MDVLFGGIPLFDPEGMTNLLLRFALNLAATLVLIGLLYYRRGGRHGLSAYDWAWALDFAERAFAR